MLKSKELTNYLERLRVARNISQESFTNGITSLRQYRRYLSGESDIPFQIIDQLCQRLSIQTINLIRELETARIDESKEVDDFYNFVVNNNKEAIDRLREKYVNRVFIDNDNRLVYEHGLILHDFINNRIPAEVASDKTKDLIDFNRIKKQTIFTLTEMFIMTSLLDLDSKTSDKQMIAERLREMLSDSSIVLGSSVNYAYQIVLFRLAKYSGTNKVFSDVIHYCQLGIDYGMRIKNFYLLDYYYYYLALANYRLGDFEKYEIMLMKCFVTLHLDGNDRKTEKFTTMINRDFNISFGDFVVEHYLKNKKQ